MDLRSVLTVLRRSARFLVLGALVGALVAYLVAGFLPKVYESSATLLVGQQLTSRNPDLNELQASQQLSRAYAELAMTRSVSEAVIERLGLDMEIKDLQDEITAVRSDDAPLLNIVVEDGSAERAALIANTIAEEIVRLSPTLSGQNDETLEFTSQQIAETKAELDAAKAELTALLAATTRTPAENDRIEVLQDRLVSLRSTYVSLLDSATSASANLVTVIDQAVPPDAPASPRVGFAIVVGGLVGLLLALFVVGLREYFDDTVKDTADVEATTGVPTLGTVESISGLGSRDPLYGMVTVVRPASSAAESFRMLRTNLDFAAVDADIRTIVVASARAGDGKTMVASNLAVAFAQSDRRTILVDADLRQPDVHRLFRLPNDRGLTTALQSRSDFLESLLRETDVPGLRILSAGPVPPNPAELVASQRMHAIVTRLAELADVVVFDTPPLLLVPDGAIVASLASGTLVVVRANETRRASARSAVDAIRRPEARVLGIVLNAYQRGAESEYGYYRSVSAREAEAATPAAQPSGPSPAWDASTMVPSPTEPTPGGASPTGHHAPRRQGERAAARARSRAQARRPGSPETDPPGSTA